jgi:hypothetical protein
MAAPQLCDVISWLGGIRAIPPNDAEAVGRCSESGYDGDEKPDIPYTLPHAEKSAETEKTLDFMPDPVIFYP